MDVKLNFNICPYLNGGREKRALPIVLEKKYERLRAQGFFMQNNRGQHTTGSNTSGAQDQHRSPTESSRKSKGGARRNADTSWFTTAARPTSPLPLPPSPPARHGFIL